MQAGLEVIVGIEQDPQFGPVLLFGLGGIFTEAIREVTLRVCPIIRDDTKEMIREVRGFRLLEGFRGGAQTDIDALVKVLLKVSALAMALKDRLTELDINPLLVLPKGQGVRAVDALIVLSNGSQVRREIPQW